MLIRSVSKRMSAGWLPLVFLSCMAISHSSLLAEPLDESDVAYIQQGIESLSDLAREVIDTQNHLFSVVGEESNSETPDWLRVEQAFRVAAQGLEVLFDAEQELKDTENWRRLVRTGEAVAIGGIALSAVATGLSGGKDIVVYIASALYARGTSTPFKFSRLTKAMGSRLLPASGLVFFAFLGTELFVLGPKHEALEAAVAEAVKEADRRSDSFCAIGLLLSSLDESDFDLERDYPRVLEFCSWVEGAAER